MEVSKVPIAITRTFDIFNFIIDPFYWSVGQGVDKTVLNGVNAKLDSAIIAR